MTRYLRFDRLFTSALDELTELITGESPEELKTWYKIFDREQFKITQTKCYKSCWDTSANTVHLFFNVVISIRLPEADDKRTIIL
ncbi:hypothetical protein RCL_jg13983.t1 [Rhizophagus clarus]|uniref:Uncharacterized protein n=1 Tax=Rhizophagus clarus TaxID=94130 RepID=A0A8H3QWD9_9GLOM|nr:hypothetical protein RCL_jg13983.t1 [Rhizophagus clarus]